MTVYAPSAMVCAADRLAAQAGVSALRAGGSAADAALAANAVLSVTSPHLCGMGGDLFALVHQGAGAPVALNASGRAGSGADPARLRAEGHAVMPLHGDVRAVTVPGCVDGWMELHARFGRLPLTALFADAVRYAEEGFPASPLLVAAVPRVAGAEGAADLLAATRSGARVRRPGVARTLRAVAEGGREAFYGGEFGRGLLRVSGGEFTESDLKPVVDWVEPLGRRVFGHDVWTIPANSQGYLTLLGLAVAEGLDLPVDASSADWAHLLVESARAAGHDRPDVLHEDADLAALLTGAAVAARRALVRRDRRAELADRTVPGGTTYLCAVDGEGMGVSLIQSNASGFGSGLFEPATGIGLHNRGLGFSLVEGHPAEYRPGRRPPHTLAPALVTRPDGSLRAVLGTQGGDAQPQALLQILARLLYLGETPGAAMAAPRWRIASATGFDTWQDTAAAVELESAAPGAWDELAARGHEVRRVDDGRYGHANLIEVGEDGMRGGAADPRALVGAAAGY